MFERRRLATAYNIYEHAIYPKHERSWQTPNGAVTFAGVFNLLVARVQVVHETRYTLCNAFGRQPSVQARAHVRRERNEFLFPTRTTRVRMVAIVLYYLTRDRRVFLSFVCRIKNPYNNTSPRDFRGPNIFSRLVTVPCATTHKLCKNSRNGSVSGVEYNIMYSVTGRESTSDPSTLFSFFSPLKRRKNAEALQNK